MGSNILNLFSAIAVAVAGASAGHAFAGHYNIHSYGDVDVDDIAAEVTDEFTAHYPHNKWTIFLHTEAGVTSGGVRYCVGTVGVVPKGSNDFPVNRYTSVRINTDPGPAMTVGEKRTWSVKCAKDAVTNMMSDKMKDIYKPQSIASVEPPAPKKPVEAAPTRSAPMVKPMEPVLVKPM